MSSPAFIDFIAALQGCGQNVPYGLPYGPPYGLTVVIFFIKTRLSIAVNLRKPRAPSICHIYGSLQSSWRRFTLTRGRSESEKPAAECRVNTTFRAIS